MADYSPGIRSNWHGSAIIGALQGVSLGGPTSIRGDGTWGRHLQVGMKRNDTEGTPDVPCMELRWPGFWRTRWVVDTGDRTLRIYAKQVVNQDVRPSVIIKANADVGLAADAEFFAGASTGWVLIEATFTATAPGVVWVEFHNNLRAVSDSAYFDHVSAT